MARVATQRSEQTDPLDAAVAYVYSDEYGAPLFRVLRRQGKRFVQQRWNPETRRWQAGLGSGVRRVLYRLPEVMAAAERGETVIVVEGEKDADRLHLLISSYGWVATTSSAGASQWRAEYAASFRGSQRVVVIPDADAQGATYALAVATSVREVVADVRIVELPDLPRKGDVSDWLDRDHCLDELIRLIEGAGQFQPPKPAEAEPIERRANGHRYRADRDGLWVDKPGGTSGRTELHLANFSARIVADTEVDEGEEFDARRHYELEATLASDRIGTRRFLVPVERFRELGWVSDQLGASAIIYAGRGIREHVPVAIQLLSPDVTDRRVYAHSGWRNLEGSDCYLHAGGAITTNGLRSDVEVNLSGRFDGCVLPQPPEGDAAAHAVRCSLRVLDVAGDEVALPLLAAVYRAALGGADFSLFLAGATGIGKSELAALAQQHYGSGFDARNLPASWSSTANATELIAFAAKDALLVVDDFVTVGASADVSRAHKDADRLLRAQGNQAGRARLRADATLSRGRSPRGLIVATGEDLPRGQSLRARLVVLSIAKDSVDWAVLSELQPDAREGRLTEALSAYLQWVAPQRAELFERIRASRDALRSSSTAHGSGRHRRTSSATLELQAAFEVFLEFAVDVRAISESERAVLAKRASAALDEVATAQHDLQRSDDPVTRFLAELESGYVSGQFHIRDLRQGRRDVPQGAILIGWRDVEGLHLNPAEVYRQVAQRCAATGEAFGISQSMLWRLLRDRGLLERTDPARRKLTRRKQIDGIRVEVLDVKALGAFAEEGVLGNADHADHADQRVLAGASGGRHENGNGRLGGRHLEGMQTTESALPSGRT